ncbi:MAG: hypothetical protein KDK12_17980 [Rhodobacteraceae bacterium]|nr:hypothetical protein [Paracoccaceae bacterium]
MSAPAQRILTLPPLDLSRFDAAQLIRMLNAARGFDEAAMDDPAASDWADLLTGAIKDALRAQPAAGFASLLRVILNHWTDEQCGTLGARYWRDLTMVLSPELADV